MVGLGRLAPHNACGGSKGLNFAVRQLMKKDEDRYISEPDLSTSNLPEDEHLLSFFCVLDGHSNNKCSSYAAKHLLPNLVQYLKTGRSLKEALVLSFEKTDSDFGRSPFSCFAPKRGGTTSCSVSVRGTGKWAGGYEVVVGNAGDSRALMVPLDRSQEWKQLSTDHTPHHHKESKRVQRAGGKIAREQRKAMDVGPLRVYPGGVAVTRAIGDKDCSDAIIATPEVTSSPIPEGGARIVVASDGLWGALRNEQVAEICLQGAVSHELNAEEASTALMKAVIDERGLHDDITIVVLDVHPLILDQMMDAWPPAGRGNSDPKRAEHGQGPVITEMQDISPGGFRDLPGRRFPVEEDDITVRGAVDGGHIANFAIPGFGGMSIGMKPILKENPVRKLGKGTHLSKAYKIQNLVGRGQYGSVRAAKELSEPFRNVVVKSMATSSDRREALCNEIDTLLEVSGKHERVPKVYATYEESGALHIVMDRVDGANLFQHVSEGRHFTEVDASEIMYQVLDGLAFLHSCGIAHRDIKPDNLMVVNTFVPGGTGPVRRVKIIDFGSACFCQDDQVLRDWVGTPFYAAPEVRKHNYGKQADVWAAGALLYILVTGMPSSTMAKPLHQAMLKGEPEGLPDGLSPDLLDLMHKLLKPDPLTRLTADEALEHPWLSVRSGRTNRVPHSLEGSIKGLSLAHEAGLYTHRVRVVLSAMLNLTELEKLMSVVEERLGAEVAVGAGAPRSSMEPARRNSSQLIHRISPDFAEVDDFVPAAALEGALEDVGAEQAKEKLMTLREGQVASGLGAEHLGVQGELLRSLSHFQMGHSEVYKRILSHRDGTATGRKAAAAGGDHLPLQEEGGATAPWFHEAAEDDAGPQFHSVRAGSLYPPSAAEDLLRTL